jgi:hypothetical protein
MQSSWFFCLRSSQCATATPTTNAHPTHLPLLLLPLLVHRPAAVFTPSMFETKDLVMARQVAIQGTNNTLDRLAAINDARVFEGGKPNKQFEAAFAPINASWFDQNLGGKKWTASGPIFQGLNDTMALSNNFTTLSA